MSEKLWLGVLGLDGVSIAGTTYDPKTGNVGLILTGENCPECPEGHTAPVVAIEDLRTPNATNRQPR